VVNPKQVSLSRLMKTFFTYFLPYLLIHLVDIFFLSMLQVKEGGKTLKPNYSLSLFLKEYSRKDVQAS
jgi:hypothetical protein